jgi:tetratricopeptide (TPR) repeat protein
VFAELERAGRDELRREGLADDRIEFQRQIDLRYVGQSYELTIPAPSPFGRDDTAPLLARFHAEQALEIYRRFGDTLSTARLLNNLAGIDFLLGDVESAEHLLVEAAATAAEAGSTADVAQATSSLAQVLLHTDRPQEAREQAEASLALLAGRVDFLEELGNTQLVIAKSYGAELDAASAAEWLDQAERTFVELGATSHLAAVSIARGDVARQSGDCDAAAELYRAAAESLQDFHF